MAIHGAERHAKLKRFFSIFPPCIPREQGAGNPRIFNPLRDARFHLTKRNDYPYYGENICRGEAQAYACVWHNYFLYKWIRSKNSFLKDERKLVEKS